MLTSTDLSGWRKPIHPPRRRRGQGEGPEALVLLSQRLPRIIDQLVHEDATADGIRRIVTAVGDAIEQRLIHLSRAHFGPAPVPYAWIVLGSQAASSRGRAATRTTPSC